MTNKVYIVKYSYSGMEIEGMIVEEPSSIIVAKSTSHAVWIYHTINFPDNFKTFEEHDKWEYREGGWGLNVMEININPSSYWFIDVYPNSNIDNKLKRERNIYIHGK